MKLKITPSTGNVFRDLGFRREEAEHLLARSAPHREGLESGLKSWLLAFST
jgi:hypothetical protein